MNTCSDEGKTTHSKMCVCVCGGGGGGGGGVLPSYAYDILLEIPLCSCHNYSVLM